MTINYTTHLSKLGWLNRIRMSIMDFSTQYLDVSCLSTSASLKLLRSCSLLDVLTLLLSSSTLTSYPKILRTNTCHICKSVRNFSFSGICEAQFSRGDLTSERTAKNFSLQPVQISSLQCNLAQWKKAVSGDEENWENVSGFQSEKKLKGSRDGKER